MTAADEVRAVASVTSDGAGAGALHGLRVVEVGQLIAGPFCGHLFADHGAEVVKVEDPSAGDPMRGWGGRYKGLGLYWPTIGRQKKSVTVDLRRPSGQEAFRLLAATCDVLIENFRPGRMEEWGLGPEDLAESNPGLIYVRVSGFGQTGPYRERAGFGSVGEAIGGLRYITGHADAPPSRCGISIGDALAATQAFTGALLALYARDGRRPAPLGQGQVVDVALYEAVFMYMESMVADYEKLGAVRARSGSELPGVAPSNAYESKSGEWIVIGANQDTVFRRFALALDHPEWLDPTSPYLTHDDRWAHHEQLDAEIAAWVEVRTSDEVLAVLEDAAVPASKIYAAPDIAADPHYAARDMILNVPEPGLDGETVAMPGVVPKLSRTPGEVASGAPRLAAHNDEIWEPLLGAERLAALRAEGTI